MCFIRQALQQGISRRRFIRGAGSAVAAPLLAGTGFSGLASSSKPVIPLNAGSYNTRLVLLGTTGGPSWWPESDRAGASSALVVSDGSTGEDVVYLVDLGCGATTRLAQAFNSGTFVNTGGHTDEDGDPTRGGKGQLTYSSFLHNVRALFFTHLHQDHTTDYPSLLLYGQGAGLKAYPPYATEATPEDMAQRLQVYGPGSRGVVESAFLPPGSKGVAPILNPDHPTPGLIDMTHYLWLAYAQTINDFTQDMNWGDFRNMVNMNEITLPGLPRYDPGWVDGYGTPINNAPWPAMDPMFVYDDGLVRVTATLVNHGPVYPSYAFRFDTADGSVVFSGDTGFQCDNLVLLAQGADILVHEVIDESFIYDLFPDDSMAALRHHMETAHTIPKNTGRHAEMAGVKTLVLNHIVPGNAPVSHLLTAATTFGGKVIVGRDLMQIGVGQPRGRK